MKKLLLLLIIPMLTYAQEDIERYKLYPTENMYTFIKLDTSNGLMWQVQYGVGDVDRLESVLSNYKIAKTVEEITEEYNEVYKDSKVLQEREITLEKFISWKEIAQNGRFKLYPTQNMYNFILLDVIKGQAYQVQWSIDKDKRMVLPISDN